MLVRLLYRITYRMEAGMSLWKEKAELLSTVHMCSCFGKLKALLKQSFPIVVISYDG